MVSVVVIDRTDGAGDEKVLPSPPVLPLELMAPPAVALEMALDRAASECTVSVFVATVGAADLPLNVGGFWPSLEARMDSLLCDREASLRLRPDGGV